MILRSRVAAPALAAARGRGLPCHYIPALARLRIVGPGCRLDTRALASGHIRGRNVMLPPIRKPWAEKRTGAVVTQMHYARQGIVTEEMEFVARRENLPAETLRSEVGRGRLIIPANIRHVELEPMAIGIASRCKINANIGNSAVTSNIDEELDKLRTSVKYGADTVMDLSTGGRMSRIREASLHDSPVPVRTRPT